MLSPSVVWFYGTRPPPGILVFCRMIAVSPQSLGAAVASVRDGTDLIRTVISFLNLCL